MSAFSGLSRPMKAAGLALVGVAIVAAVIGGITALGGNGTDEAGPGGTSAQPTTSGGTAPPSATPSVTSSSTVNPSSPTPPSPSPGQPIPGQPTPGQPQPGQPQPGQPGQQPPGPGQPGGDQQASNKWVTVRVFNNSTIKGLAARAKADFTGAGWNVTEVSNYPQGVIPATTAYYRPGTDEEAAAKQLAQEFGFKAEPRFPGIQDASPGVIVIVTNNYQASPKGS